MKCKHCDGTGTSNWCINGVFKTCEYCNGTGEVEVVGDSVTDVCDKCGGTGEITLTNEEWFCALSTEEKAKFLRKIYCDGKDDYVGEWYEQTEADFVEWLKEKHHAD